MADWIEQLERLTQLHKSGALSDAEFAAQKAKVLAAQDVPAAAARASAQAPAANWQPPQHEPEREGLPKAVIYSIPVALAVGLAAWLGASLLMGGKTDPQLDPSASGAASDAAVATATPGPTQAAVMPVALDGTLKYASAEQCTAGPVLEAIYKKLDAAMDLGSGKGVSVKLDAWDQPLGIWAKSITDAGGTTTKDAAIKFPEATTWHGLRLSRVTAHRVAPPESDSSYTRSISFLEPTEKVQKTLARLGFGAPREPEYSELQDQGCGGSAQVVSLNGGAALSCSWGC